MSDMIQEPRWLNTPQSAQYCGNHRDTLRKLRATGGGPKYVRLGRQYRYRTDWLDEWMQSRGSTLLGVVPADDRSRPFRLFAEGPRVIERLFGLRCHAVTLWRWATEGMVGVKLQTVSAGRALVSTPEWVCQFWDQVDVARRKPTAKKRQAGKGDRRG